MSLRIGSAGPLCILLAALTLAPISAARAQREAGQVQGPSKYLLVSNSALKPDQGDAYAKLQSDEVQALRAANAPSHFIGMWSITGSNNVVYLHGFDSFADLQKDHEATAAMSKLMDTMHTDDAAQSAFVTEHHTSIYKYDEDLSLRAPVDLAKMRFARTIIFHVRSGRDQDWEHLVKQYVKAYQAIPNAHWAMFEKVFGIGSDNTYVLITPLTALSEVDGMLGSDKQFMDSTGEDELALLRQQGDADVESSEEDLYAFGSGISYVSDSWLTAYPDFWGKK
jgi:hypothetical protein